MNREIADDARTACRWEVMARKVGNVHPTRGFDGLDHAAFLRSADAFAETLTASDGVGVGETILSAVRKRITVTPSNTNLGIILLLVPLATCKSRSEFRERLAALSVDDAKLAYEAIRIASAGGMGDVSSQSVANEPTVTLIDAMRLAAERDMIAKQYATAFADIFEFGVPNLMRAYEEFGCVEAAIIKCQMQWLAAFPDTLIARKCGLPIAVEMQDRARDVLAAGGLSSAAGRASGVRFDAHLRSDGHRLNPGTTADLVTACLFVALRERKLKPSDPFPWSAPDWL